MMKETICTVAGLVGGFITMLLSGLDSALSTVDELNTMRNDMADVMQKIIDLKQSTEFMACRLRSHRRSRHSSLRLHHMKSETLSIRSCLPLER